MRIAMVSTTAVRVPPTAYGGTELVVHYLTEGLVRAGHSVALFGTGDSETSAQLRARYPEAVWPIDSLAEIDHIAWSLAQVRSGGFDVVHVQQAPALALSRFVDVPFVYTLHHPREETLSRLYRRYPRVHYVAISHRQCEREEPLPRMQVVHHGVDPDDYPFVAEPEGYVGFIGRFAPVKGPHRAIDAALRAGVPIHVAGLPHAGEGEQFHAAEMVQRLTRPGVTWVGEVGGTTKRAHLGGAVATLFPISWEEPFGLVMIESMMCGTPVIAFPRGAAPEVIEDGVTGFLVRDETEMAAAIGRARALDRRRCRAYAVERFHADRMVREYANVYATAAAERARRARMSVPTIVGRGPARVAGVERPS